MKQSACSGAASAGRGAAGTFTVDKSTRGERVAHAEREALPVSLVSLKSKRETPRRLGLTSVLLFHDILIKNREFSQL